jgi:hypothetical protein
VIFDAIFGLLFGLLNSIASLLPSFTAPGAVTDVGGGLDLYHEAVSFGAHMKPLDGFVPLGLVSTCLGIVLASWGVAGSVRLILFLYDRFPGKAS